MDNLAKVIPFRPSVSVVERQVADIDDGYTRIANELLEAVMAADLTARQLQVLLDHALSGIRVVGQSFWVHNDTITLLLVGFAPVSCENAESFSAGIFGFRIFPEGPLLALVVRWQPFGRILRRPLTALVARDRILWQPGALLVAREDPSIQPASLSINSRLSASPHRVSLSSRYIPRPAVS